MDQRWFGDQHQQAGQSSPDTLVSRTGVRKKDVGIKEVAPKHWLSHTQETRRGARSFTAWEGTAAYKEWKARHPGEKFPKFPG